MDDRVDMTMENRTGRQFMDIYLLRRGEDV
jgi:hypothetical protein